ncbi:ABC transporter ATP-binding protein [Naasia aerilata]|uniref:Multidrug ABC transporter ATP-binding protein n=1 Tax=Naasia aerilata TaxID=1162966 RepID=A0ABN6XHS2_9MICO|nr:ABC transporter ATP-binding protein [Naasia aerilata]BDZ44411.1 multidrug ABC transporter ATP-binding protein [Naasia aerilata]
MLLPVADRFQVRQATLRLLRLHRGAFAVVLLLHALAAGVALVPPVVIGWMVGEIAAGSADLSVLTGATSALIAAALAQALLTRFAQRQAVVLGEQIIASLREDLVRDLMRLPLAAVESTSSGDLLSRTTNDVESLAMTVRYGIPRILIVAITIVVATIAALVVNPLVTVAVFLGVPVLVLASRTYLRRSAAGFQRQLATIGRLSGVISETAEGIRTIEALSLEEQRDRELDDALDARVASDLYTLRLRNFFFPTAQLSMVLPIVVVIGWGAFLASQGLAGVGQVTTVALLAAQLVGPIGELMAWLNSLQVSAAALARMIGVGAAVSAPGEPVEAPAGATIRAEGVRYSYKDGVDVLHGIDLELRRGERLAIVGSTGSGKSTLARLVSGIEAPRAGRVDLGDVPLVDLSVRDLRTHVALVTQEHHVFVGSIAENLRLAHPSADDDTLMEALAVVGADGWVRSLAEGLDTGIGSGAHLLTPAQSQQLALARLILLDPETLVLDEATSLLEPGAARALEHAMSVLLEGRTVVAIAHRLHTAHDADRIAVMHDGRVTEIGGHDELLARGGEYAQLWRAWNSES